MNWIKTDLGKKALSGTLIAVILPIFLGADLGVRAILESFGLPPDAWVNVFYEMFTPATLPDHLIQWGEIVGSIPVVAGFVGLYMRDKTIERYGLRQGMASLLRADTAVLGVWLVIAGGIAWVADYPLELIPLLQLVPFVTLQFVYFSLPGILHDWFTIPEKTTSFWTVTWVVVLTFVIAILATLVFLFPIRVLQFYF